MGHYSQEAADPVQDMWICGPLSTGNESNRVTSLASSNVLLTFILLAD